MPNIVHDNTVPTTYEIIWIIFAFESFYLLYINNLDILGYCLKWTWKFLVKL